jgi:hypothetical protein
MQIKPTLQPPDEQKASTQRADSGPSQAKPNRKKRIRRHGENMIRFNISMSRQLAERVDAAAKQDYTTRSEMIRMALLWYLRPQGRELNQADPDVILKTLQHRRALIESRKMIRQLEGLDE